MVSPANGDEEKYGGRFENTYDMFPIKWCHQRVVTVMQWDSRHLNMAVSNQVVSPASGDSLPTHRVAFVMEFPIKWCHQRVVTYPFL